MRAMRKSISEMDHWEFGAGEIANPNSSTLRRYFELIASTLDLNGDIAEFGVSRGSSIVTTGLLLNHYKSNKQILGFDTFDGFPDYSEQDSIERFHELFDSGKISSEHYERIKKNFEYIRSRGSTLTPDQLSNSGDFSNTSFELVKNKINFFGLEDKIKLYVGDFTKNLNQKLSGNALSLVLIDSDLYKSYSCILPSIWSKLTSGGYIYLDEYYSLKFPGPRIAVDEFISSSGAQLIQLPKWLDFERWAICKN